MTAQEEQALTGKDVLLYDGVCALCNGFVRFTLRRDPQARLRYVPIASGLGRELLSRYGTSPEELDSIVLLRDALTPGETFLVRMQAVAAILGGLWRPWSWMGWVLKSVPGSPGRELYRLIARMRYKLARRYEVCPMPEPEVRERFLGL